MCSSPPKMLNTLLRWGLSNYLSKSGAQRAKGCISFLLMINTIFHNKFSAAAVNFETVRNALCSRIKLAMLASSDELHRIAGSLNQPRQLNPLELKEMVIGAFFFKMTPCFYLFYYIFFNSIFHTSSPSALFAFY